MLYTSRTLYNNMSAQGLRLSIKAQHLISQFLDASRSITQINVLIFLIYPYESVKITSCAFHMFEPKQARTCCSSGLQLEEVQLCTSSFSAGLAKHQPMTFCFAMLS